ncbi:hypothetical protein NQ315_010005 [Exocentrus adspersus]|uniref:Uncharacterized protein n=1 Tax=Exocentrus adspersus TaxID=1586481 RepID=A0AAV8VKZ2_9CUCU|nr:hypothetical protein NQ315_010005 [Exocentrus adspersus]
MKIALRNKKDSSPGLDRITYSMLQNLPEPAGSSLLDTYNAILKNEIPVPDIWKAQLVTPIPKAQKNQNTVSGWRPITLSCCPGKILETMVKNRLEWELENKGLLNPYQTGFRRGKGTYDHLINIYTTIQSKICASQKVIVVLLDITSAYDNVRIPKLISKVISHGAPNDLVHLIRQFLTNRKIYVKDPNSAESIGPRYTNQGVPQGSPLSPLLYNIYTNSLQDCCEENVKILQYADDIAIITAASDLQQSLNKTNMVLDNVAQFLFEHGLPLASHKSQAILFQRGGNPNPPGNLQINNETIPWQTEIKYLGVKFDCKLSWKPHIEMHLPCYEIPYEVQVDEINYKDLGLSKENNNKEEFLRVANREWSDWTWIFTDASKDTENNTGIGVFAADTINFAARIPPFHDICSAETIALNYAMEKVIDKRIRRAIIFSDSKSALQKITSSGIQSKNDYRQLVTKQIITEARLNSTEIELAWIPSHSHISGNERADFLANLGTTLQPTNAPLADHKEFFPIYKENLRNSWVSRFTTISKIKGKNYAASVKTPYTTPWFKTMKATRKEITTLVRIRSNHCSVPAHLNRIGVKDTPNCRCGETGDIAHVFLRCPQNQHNINTLYSKIAQQNTQYPLSLHDFFFNNLSLARIKSITEFIQASGLCI